MDRKIKILIFLNVILAILITFIIYFNQADNFNLNPEDLEDCKTLKFNGDDKINLVFFSPKDEAEKYSDFLLTIAPLNKNKNAFNFYYIDGYKPACEIYQEKALLCYDKETIKKAASCPNDFIVVIEEKNRDIRSSAYMNVMSINSKHSLTVLAHEFGHVFVNLAEEYVPATLPKGAKNCVDSCEKFDINNGCFLGCSKTDFFRSIDNGIMRTLSSTNFGIFNERILLNKIKEVAQERTKFGLTGNAIQNIDCVDQNYYMIQGKYSKDKLTIKEKSIEQGCMNELGSGYFEYKLTTEDDKIKSGEFNPEFIYTDSQEIDKEEQISGAVFESKKDFYLKTPLTENPKTLEILKDGKILTTIDLAETIQTPKQIPCKK